ncbi:hypothetical protein C7N43_08940 [Sphingobacteriales bacterium UPWRP_1]|nr:hypothetical protein C7N43_08940 [Sphingobacteriales bacterium UPWRP_1]
MPYWGAVLQHRPVTGSQIGIGQLPAGLYFARAQYKPASDKAKYCSYSGKEVYKLLYITQKFGAGKNSFYTCLKCMKQAVTWPR